MRHCLIGAFVTCAAVVFAAGAVTAQDTVNVGFILPMTGPVASVGKQVSAGAQLYVQQHGNSVAGKKIELLIRGRRWCARCCQARRSRISGQ